MHFIRNKQRSLTGELVLVLSLVTCLVAGATGALAYAFFAHTHSRELQRGAEETTRNLSEVLALPLWNLDGKTMESTARAALRITGVRSVTVRDREGAVILAAGDQAGMEDALIQKRDIVHEGWRIGSVEVGHSKKTLAEMRLRIITLMVATVLCVILSTYGATVFVVRRLVKRPIADLSRDIERIAGGGYSQEIPPAPETDINRIVGSVNRMAGEIALRTASLEAEIARRREADRAFRESQEQFRVLLDNHPDPVAVYDMEENVSYLNPAFTQAFGWTLEERQGRRMDDFVPEENWPETRELIAKVLKGETFSGAETSRRTREGRVIPVSISGAIYKDAAGTPRGAIVTLRDISSQKQMEIQISQGEKMRAIGTLAGGIAHDVNNLLMAIQGNLSMMLLELPPDSPHLTRVEAIGQCVRSGAALTRQLLGFARGGKYETKILDLNRVIRRHCETFSRTRREVTIHEQYQEDLWPVKADQGQVEQVLLNLCINAWQAMPEGGDLHIQTQNILVDHNYAVPFRVAPGKYVRVSVTDTGVGMDEEVRQRIFEPFFTTRHMGKGTGMGLASVYGIIKNHEGFINCYSAPGRGTTFTVHFPAVPGKAPGEAPRAPEPAEAAVSGNGTVLVVDDEKEVLKVAREMLAGLGYTVLCAESGAEAVDLFREHSQDVSVVLLDMIMPRMSGAATFEKIREIAPDVRAVLTSGYSINGQASTLMEMGCAAFLQKPYTLPELSRTLRTVLAGNGKK
jgi:PAS domain S-box-containing protein